MLHCFQRFSKTYYFLLDFLMSFQSVLIRNIRFLVQILRFITTTLHDGLDKNRYQLNISWSIYFGVDHRFRLFWKMWSYYNLTKPGVPQGNPSSELFWTRNICEDNIQFPVHHKKLVKTNKHQSIITMKSKLVLRGTGVPKDCCNPDKMLSHTKDWVVSQG